MADWRAALPELSEEWPAPSQPGQASPEAQMDFGSVVLHDTLQKPPTVASYSHASVPGTMLVHTDHQPENENLAWAARAKQNDLLNPQTSQANQAGAFQKGHKPKDSKSRLQSLFEPPTPEPQTPQQWFTPGSQSQTPAYARNTQTSTAIKLSKPQTEVSTTPADPVPNSGTFTFSCPRQRSSWKGVRHFNASDVSSPQQPQQQLPDRTPRHSTPDDLQTPGQSAQPLRLFQFNYDTYTKNHLEALVEEIDELSMSQQPIEKGDEEPYWQEGSPELLPYADDDDRPVGRSAKRLRLSPEAVLHTPHAFSQPPPRTPGSALRDRIRSRRQGAGHTSTLGLSQTPMPHHSRQAQSLPAGFKSAPPPNRYLRSSLLNSKSSFDHQAETSLQVPVQQKLQAAQALMDRIIQSHSESDMNQSQQSSSEESDEAAQPSHLELQPEQQQLAQSVGAGAALLPPLLEVTEEDIEPPMDEEGHHQEEEDFDLLQPMGSPALSDGTVPLPPSPDLSQFTGTPTFAHRHHYGPSHTEARLDEEHSFADIPAPPTVTSHSQKWSSVAEANLRRSLSNHPAFVQSSPMPRQHNQNQQHLGPNSFKSSAPSQTRVTSAGSGFSTQSTGISSHTSANTHHPKYPHMTTIAPTDVDHNHMLAASERNGMVFDQQLNRWVKAKRKVSGEHTGPHQVAQARVEEEEDASEEEDPFQEFESFADKSQAQFSIPPPDWADADFDGPEPLPAEGNCEEEPEPSTDGRVPLHKLREQTPFVQTGADLVTPTEPDQSMEQQQSVLRPPLVNRSSGLSDTLSPPAFTHSASTPITHRSPSPQPPSTAYAALPGPATPMPGPRVHSAPTVPRSAMKARHSLVDSTPQPKGPNGSETSSAGMRSDAIRSVSFSDGRTSGKMADATPIVVPAFKRSSSARPSGLKNEISISSSDENSSKDLSRHSLSKPSEDDGDDSTSTATSHTDSREGSESLHLPLDVISDEDEDHASPVARNTSVPMSLRSRAQRIRPRSDSSLGADPFLNRSDNSLLSVRGGVKIGNQTILTECSFGVSHDRLLKLITDVEPYEPCWESLTSINLASKKAESLVRLKEFLPSLDEADLSKNEIAWLTGVPSGVRTLLLNQNRITSVTSFSHLKNLERLDISNNALDSINQLSCLIHLRELKADGNAITDISGLSKVDGLIKLSLKGNKLKSIDFNTAKWHRLESINLEDNELQEVHGLEKLTSCVFLNLERNQLVSLTALEALPRLRVMKLSRNPISSFDARPFCNLRTLFIDNARLGSMRNLEALAKLENLSVREQQGTRLQLPTRSLRDIRRLFLSGNSLPRSFPSHQYFDIVFLELSACRLVTLPPNFAALVPNCRYLNLSHNFLEDIQQLAGLSRLRRLSVVGSRLEKSKAVLSALTSMSDLEVLDLRLNPLTLSFYAPFAPDQKTLPLDAGLDQGGADWRKADRKYVRSMPDVWYLRRMAYRGALMHTCPSLQLVDGVKVEEKEQRQKIIELCQHIEHRQKEVSKQSKDPQQQQHISA